MPQGTLHIEAKTGTGGIPVSGARVEVRSTDGAVLYRLNTDSSGSTPDVTITAPPASNSLTPDTLPTHSNVDVTITAPGYIGATIRGVQIYDGVEAILPVTMLPNPESRNPDGTVNPNPPDYSSVYDIPPPAVETGTQQGQEGPRGGRVLSEVVIPDYITVHLGPPNSNARNVTVPFVDYIKNVVSSEIYATWPEESIRANTYAIMTFALNRIYTEWYRARGYNFDITNSTAYDMFYVENRDIFKNISEIVDDVFGEYARREGRRDPFFTQFCNGTTATCPGLSQWGTVPLAQQGYDALQILRYYYPSDLEIAEADHIGGVTTSYPGSPLRVGSSGADVKRIQDMLNRIRVNYPAIPQINPADGVFGGQTQEAVQAFQRIFNLTADGVVGKDTWNKISYIYTAVTRLAELDSEGERIGIGTNPPTSTLREGSRGADVTELQFLLNYIGSYYPMVPQVIQDSVFGASTTNAVKAFQTAFGLTADGVVGKGTWNELYGVYKSVKGDTGTKPPVPPTPPPAPNYPYPGTALRYGDRGTNVAHLQELLNAAAAKDSRLNTVTVDGAFGTGTQNAVLKLQQLYGLSADGVAGSATWSKLLSIINGGGGGNTFPAYPGYLISQGSQGNYVSDIQRALNALRVKYPQIPALTVDGSFGPGTKAAVQAFQRIFGLTADGVVGQATWNMIRTQYMAL